MKNEIKNRCFVFFIPIFFIETKKPGGYSYLCTKGVTTMITRGERLIQLEGFSPRDGYRSMGESFGDAVVHTRFYFSL
jgi:hypothetical protein